ncbi:hypothetical protein CFO_g4099 [Ceratocystis platani]|uniref:Uncharacterized protein n=1 Tax=Ceratocystis fimbriata f. sp. platani TaxID=88771 RepID=A0A0F8B1N4_CERFI|nr:hypothetical protein CFO_g4099 [Ceratocystis platani]
MKLSSSFLLVVLPSVRLCLAGIIGDQGYKALTQDHFYVVRSPHYFWGIRPVDVIQFDPEQKGAIIHRVENDWEDKNKDTLSLTEIYTALCEKEQVEPSDMSWLSFDVDTDAENETIGLIRNGRKMSRGHDVKLFPGDKEWESILLTQSYKTMRQLTKKRVYSITLRNQYEVDYWGKRINSISFSFLPADANSEAEADGEEQGAAIKALFDEER